MSRTNKELLKLTDKKLIEVIEDLPYPLYNPRLLQTVADLKFLARVREYLK